MKKENDKFMKQKEKYLKTRFIGISDAQIRPATSVAGTQNVIMEQILVDLQENSAMSANFREYSKFVQLVGVTNAMTNARPKANWIRANYLSYRMGYSTTMTLDNSYPYFFTSGLQGCSILIRRTGDVVKVSHLNMKANPAAANVDPDLTADEIFERRLSFGRDQVMTLLPNQYRDGHAQVTVAFVGFYAEKSGWVFWYQRSAGAGVMFSQQERVVRLI